MKRTLVPTALSLVLLASSNLIAQQPQSTPDAQQPPAPITHSHHGHGHNPHQEAMMLSRRLNLSTDQTARIEPILAGREQKMSALRANTSLSPEDMHQQMRSIHQTTRTQLDAVLTPEQQEQMRAMHHGRHHGEQPSQAPASGS